ncbi:hypothetical protein CCHR01_11749 [Colletotrichum chrysophilum]|uniref:Uncharacterized protein n=1 Tax=Colletotrichum chrysophilum TaxID=1836956 RepID=A0AAD9AFE4_9PEZI|nr:hypothetical protein CCHR01_11749 [Colletotrichum chrysophilum]
MLFWKLSEMESTLFLHLAPALQSEQCKSPTEPQSGTARRYSGPSGNGAIRLVQGKGRGGMLLCAAAATLTTKYSQGC